MKTYTYQEILDTGITVTINEDFNDEEWDAGAMESMLEKFDPKKPLVIESDGYLSDGNHRWTVLTKEGKEDTAIFTIQDDMWGIECKMREEYAEGHELFNSDMNFEQAWRFDDDLYYGAIEKFGA